MLSDETFGGQHQKEASRGFCHEEISCNIYQAVNTVPTPRKTDIILILATCVSVQQAKHYDKKPKWKEQRKGLMKILCRVPNSNFTQKISCVWKKRKAEGKTQSKFLTYQIYQCLSNLKISPESDVSSKLKEGIRQTPGMTLLSIYRVTVNFSWCVFL